MNDTNFEQKSTLPPALPEKRNKIQMMGSIEKCVSSSTKFQKMKIFRKNNLKSDAFSCNTSAFLHLPFSIACAQDESIPTYKKMCKSDYTREKVMEEFDKLLSELCKEEQKRVIPCYTYENLIDICSDDHLNNKMYDQMNNKIDDHMSNKMDIQSNNKKTGKEPNSNIENYIDNAFPLPSDNNQQCHDHVLKNVKIKKLKTLSKNALKKLTTVRDLKKYIPERNESESKEIITIRTLTQEIDNDKKTQGFDFRSSSSISPLNDLFVKKIHKNKKNCLDTTATCKALNEVNQNDVENIHCLNFLPYDLKMNENGVTELTQDTEAAKAYDKEIIKNNSRVESSKNSCNVKDEIHDKLFSSLEQPVSFSNNDSLDKLMWVTSKLWLTPEEPQMFETIDVSTSSSENFHCVNFPEESTETSFIGSERYADGKNYVQKSCCIKSNVNPSDPDLSPIINFKQVEKIKSKLPDGILTSSDLGNKSCLLNGQNHSKLNVMVETTKNKSSITNIIRSTPIIGMDKMKLNEDHQTKVSFHTESNSSGSSISSQVESIGNNFNSVQSYLKKSGFNINLYIEGKNLHFGPLSFEIFPKMTLGLLKMMVEKQLGFKTYAQTWIINRFIANDNDVTLWDYGVKPNSHLFLYLDSSHEKTCEHVFQKLNLCSSELKYGNYKNLIEPVKSYKNEHFPSKSCDKQRLTKLLSKCKNKKETLNISRLITKNLESDSSHSSNHLVAKDEVLATQNDASNTVIINECETPGTNKIDLKNIHMRECIEEPNQTNFMMSNISNTFSTTLSIDAEEELKNFTLVQTVCSTPHSILNPDSIDDAAIEVSSTAEVERNTNSDVIEKNDHLDYIYSRKESLENYNIQLETESMDLVENTEQFTCPVCFQIIHKGKGVVLHDCLHCFCKDCLSSAILYSEGTVVKCPYYDEHYSCQANLQQREIKSLVTEEVYEKFLHKSIMTAESLAEGSFHCKTPDCVGWCMIEENANVFHCPVCHHWNCLNCQAIHEGLNCRQYQDKLRLQQKIDHEAEKTLELLNNMMMEGKAMKCPKCDLILMKKWGCDWLKCAICKTEICWITKGPRWGPKGQGDISAGCKCGVNGIKCHPSCTYCH